jgi:hypothetical protein
VDAVVAGEQDASDGGVTVTTAITWARSFGDACCHAARPFLKLRAVVLARTCPALSPPSYLPADNAVLAA